MQWSELILKGMEITAWPLTVILLTILFRVPLFRLIDRIVRAKGPGGTEVTFGEQQPLLEGVRSLPEPNQADDLRRELDKVAKVREEAALRDRGQTETIQALEQEVAKYRGLLKRFEENYAGQIQYTEQLEFDYLRRALTIPMKQMLSWVERQVSPTRTALAARASELQISPGDFENTLDALVRFGIIAIIGSDGARITISEKGKRFVFYMKENATRWERIIGL